MTGVQTCALPILKKDREVVILLKQGDFEKALEKYKDSEKDIFICGGATIYKYFLENYNLDNIYISKLKENIRVEKANEPLYFPNVEEYGYKLKSEKEYNDFFSLVYSK